MSLLSRRLEGWKAFQSCFYWGNLGKTKIRQGQISSEESSKHNYQNRMLFSFVWLFRRFHQAIIFLKFFEILKNFLRVFWLYPMKKKIIWFLAKSQDSEHFSEKVKFWKNYKFFWPIFYGWKEIILNTPSTEPQSFQEFHWK